MPFKTFACPIFGDLNAGNSIDLIFSSRGHAIPEGLRSKVKIACRNFSDPSPKCERLLKNMTVVTGFPVSGSVEHLAECMQLELCECGDPGAESYCSVDSPCKRETDGTCHKKEPGFRKNMCPDGTTECQDQCVWGSTILLHSNQRERVRLESGKM